MAHTMDNFKIGDKLWVWDENRRVYDRSTSGFGPPIWREHYRQLEIVDETSRSWVLSDRQKINKKGLSTGGLWPRICRTEREIDKAEWVEKHRHRIAAILIRGKIDYETLRQIAEMLGYDEQ